LKDVWRFYIKYWITGIIAIILDIILFYFILKAGVNAPLANIITIIIIMTVSFVLDYKWTFK